MCESCFLRLQFRVPGGSNVIFVDAGTFIFYP